MSLKEPYPWLSTGLLSGVFLLRWIIFISPVSFTLVGQLLWFH